MKMQILPPVRAKASGTYFLLLEAGTAHPFMTPWGVILEVASDYRYRRAVAPETQRDLLRFCAVNSIPVRVGLADGKTAFFYFDRATVDRWLNDGGRTWIIAELEARSSKRVVPFVRKNGGGA